MSSLLPPNATKLEKNAEKLGEKISSLAVPFIDLHRIDRCPAAHLPWLAWEHRVEKSAMPSVKASLSMLSGEPAHQSPACSAP